MSIDFGTDIRLDLFGSTDPKTGKPIPATNDADPLFSTVSGVALVRQDAAIRLLTDGSQILPQVDDDGNEIEHDGFDVRSLVGLPLADVQRKQPTIARAFAADDRITSPSVIITDNGARPFATVSIACSGMTALGPFRLVFLLSSQPDAASAIQIIEG